MSYRGRPSKGCQMCRSRKVKCDETKPICERCRDAGHECVYRDNFELFFRDQTASTARKAQRQRKGNQQRSSSPEPGSSSGVESTRLPFESSQQSKASLTPTGAGLIASSSVSQMETSQSLSTPSQTIRRPPSPIADVVPSSELCQLAIKRFFFDYVVHPDPMDYFRTDLSHLPTFFDQARPDSTLVAAVTAAAFANYARETPNTSWETYGLRYYVSALKLMSQAIQDPREVGSIETLLTTFVLNLYEVIAPTHVSTGQASWVSHRVGGSLLLSLRGPQQFQELLNARLFGVAYLTMIINCLAEGKRAPGSIDAWVPNVVNISSDFTATQILLLMHKTADLTADWADYKDRVSSPTLIVADQLCLTELVLGNALNLDTEFEDWNRLVKTSEWSFESYEYPFLKPWEQDLVDLAGGPSVMHSYASYWAANAWNLYRASRIRLNGIILRLMQRLTTLSTTISENSNPGSREHQACIQALMCSLVDDVCSSVIAVLTLPLPEKPAATSLRGVCGIRGYYSLWPLITSEKNLGLTSSPDAFERQQWIQNVLGFIRSKLGLGNAQTNLQESVEI